MNQNLPAGVDQESIKKFELIYEELSKYSEEKPIDYISYRTIKLIMHSAQLISNIEDSMPTDTDGLPDDELWALSSVYMNMTGAVKIIDRILDQLLNNNYYQAFCSTTPVSDMLPQQDTSNYNTLNIPLPTSLGVVILINSTPRLIGFHGVVAQAGGHPLPNDIVSKIKFELGDLREIIDEVFRFIMDEAGLPSDESTLNDMIRDTESLFSDELLTKYKWLISTISHVNHEVIVLNELIRRNQSKGEINNDTRKS